MLGMKRKKSLYVSDDVRKSTGYAEESIKTSTGRNGTRWHIIVLLVAAVLKKGSVRYGFDMAVKDVKEPSKKKIGGRVPCSKT